MSPDVLIVTVNYHTEAEVERLIASLIRQSVPWRLVILNNGSSPTGELRLARAVADNPAVRQQDCGGNLGYFGAAHSFVSGLRCESSSDRLPEWLIVTNPDVILADDFLVRLTEVTAQVVAPRLLDAGTARDLNPFMEQRPSLNYARSRRLIFANPVIAQAWILASWLAGDRRWGRLPEKRLHLSHPIYAGHGAILAFHRSYFSGGGSLYHEPFLFGEEVTVAESVRAMGGRLVYAPSAVATHTGHVTTGIRRSRQLLGFQRESARYIERLIADSS